MELAILGIPKLFYAIHYVYCNNFFEQIIQSILYSRTLSRPVHVGSWFVTGGEHTARGRKIPREVGEQYFGPKQFYLKGYKEFLRNRQLIAN
jgi:hypothetical protein